MYFVLIFIYHLIFNIYLYKTKTCIKILFDFYLSSVAYKKPLEMYKRGKLSLQNISPMICKILMSYVKTFFNLIILVCLLYLILRSIQCFPVIFYILLAVYFLNQLPQLSSYTSFESMCPFPCVPLSLYIWYQSHTIFTSFD